MSDQTTSDELVFDVERELAVLKGGLQQSQKISGVQRTGVIRDAAREFVRTNQLHAFAVHGLGRHGIGTVSALCHGQVHHHRSGAHAIKHVLTDQAWGSPARHLGCTNRHISLGELVGQLLSLRGQENDSLPEKS